jgi:hypothetical protein
MRHHAGHSFVELTGPTTATNCRSASIQPNRDWFTTVGDFAIAGFAMKIRLLIVLVLLALGAGSALAVMNNGRKSSPTGWCAPVSGYHG